MSSSPQNGKHKKPSGALEAAVKTLAMVGVPSALLVGAYAATEDIESFGKLVTVIGLPSVVALLAVWFGIQWILKAQERSSADMLRREEQALMREERMGSRIDSLESWSRTELVGIIKAQVSTTEKNTEAFKELQQTMIDQHTMNMEQHRATIDLVRNVVADTVSMTVKNMENPRKIRDRDSADGH